MPAQVVPCAHLGTPLEAGRAAVGEDLEPGGYSWFLVRTWSDTATLETCLLHT